jgi:bifunctional DNase/RNase
VPKPSISGLALALGIAWFTGGCDSPGRRALIAADADLRPVSVEGVGLDPRGVPVLTLVEKDGAQRRLPIWIGEDQAHSIQAALAEIDPPRPNTHDLLVGVLGAVERRIERVAITDLHDDTYYAVIVLAGAAGGLQLDARPSDAIALAVRTGAAILVEERVLAGTGAADPEERLDVDWRPQRAAPELQHAARIHSRSTLGL